MVIQAKKNRSSKTKPVKLPSSWALIKKTWFESSTFWRPLLGITLIYMVLYFILVMGLNFSTAWRDNLLFSNNKLGEAFGLIFGAFGSGGFSPASSSDTTTIMQFLLFILASMAIIWTLRKLQALKQIKWRDAYYQGTASFIPTIIVTIVLAMTFIPAIIGSSLLTTALQLSTSGYEVLVVGIVVGLLLLISLLLFFMFWPAFYIVSLPQTRPVQAIRSALKITKKRRLSILRKTIAWVMVSLIVMLIILIPVAMFIPSAVAYFVFILLFLLFAFSHVYLYNLYRSLL